MLNVGILGAGGIARSMSATLRAMRQQGEEVCLFAIASRDQAKADAFAAREGCLKAYGSYEAMLDDPQIGLVYLATPHAMHAEEIRQCADAGKAVLCEKAFAGNLRQAEEALSFAAKKKVLVTEAIWTRYMPSRRMIQDLIDAGEIGIPQLLTANLGYAIRNVERVRRPELAGGALLDVGVYTLNFASMFLGNAITRMESSALLMDTGMDLTDSITFHYESGAAAQLMCTAALRTDRCGIIYGDKGWLRVDNINNPHLIEIWSAEDRAFHPRRILEVPRQLTGYEYEVEACMKALAEGRLECPEMPHSETLEIMRQMDALRESWGVRYPFD